MDTRRFFEKALPQLVVDKLQEFAATQGALAVLVRGVGRWTIRFGDVERPVADQFDRDADLKLYVSRSAFEQLLEGTLDVRRALAERELSGQGDFALLERLGYFLAPTLSPLATRLSR